MGGGHPEEAWRQSIALKYLSDSQATALPGAIELISAIEDMNGKWGIVTSGTSGLAAAWLDVTEFEK